MSYKRKSSKRNPLIPPLIISILLHIILLLFFSLNTELLLPKKQVAEKKKDNFIEISEIPVPEEKETQPPEKTTRLANRSRTVEKEKTLDEFTKKGASSIPQTPTTSVQSPKVNKRVEENSKKSAKNNPRESEKDTIKTASLPKYKKPDIKIPENKKDKPADDKKIDKISKKELFQTVQNPFLSPNQNSLSLKGTRNVPKEDTVDLNTTEYKYLSYFLKIKRQIEGVWIYPKESRISRQQGELLLVFTITSDGYLENVELLETSGYIRLDNEALRAIKVAAPFSPFPSSWDLDRLNIKAAFVYGFRWSIRR